MRVLLVCALLLAPVPAMAANECALRPLFPPVTYPCKRLIPQCFCDAQGNCKWVYLCDTGSMP